MAKCLPPRAFSVREGDAAYCPAWRIVGPTFDVFFDGKPCLKVISYDCEAGTVVRYQSDEAGRYVIDGDEMATETVHGDVSVSWRATV